MPILYARVHLKQRSDIQMSEAGESMALNRLAKGADMGRKPSDDYDPGEPGMWGEPYEMIDDVEGDDDDDD